MKKITRIMLAAGTMGILTACSTGENKSEAARTSGAEESESEVLRFGLLPAESAVPIILAEENGYFDEEQVEVDLTSFSSPNDRNVAVQAGELDGMIADVMTALSLREGGVGLTITSDINEEFKLLSSPDSGITEISQLDGKEVSLVPKFLLEYIMDEMAAESSITYNVVSIPSIPARYEALLENQIDAVIFTEPQASSLEEKGAHVLASSSASGIKGGAILFSDALVAEHPDEIAAFYRAYNQAVAYMNETDAAEYSGILEAYQFPDEMADYLAGKEEGYSEAAAVPQEQYDRIEQWTKEKEMISQDYAYDDVTDFSMIND